MVKVICLGEAYDKLLHIFFHPPYPQPSPYLLSPDRLKQHQTAGR